MKMKYRLLAAVACAAPIAIAYPAYAGVGDPVKISDDLTIDPIIEGRLRYEHVDQPATDADALTMRLRTGAEAKLKGGLSLLVEAESTLAIIDDYADTNGKGLGNSVVADPENIELNRLQVQFKGDSSSATLGRQRINIDDQRWVGSVGWRQNEQTFDAVSGEAKVGPVTLSGTYSWSQRTIFGIDADTRQAYSGQFYFVGAATKIGPVNVKGFAYLLDYNNDEPVLGRSSQTYGLRATTAFKLTPQIKLDLAGSYARQSDYKGNTAEFGVDYVAAEAGLAYQGFKLTGGYELLGNDGAFALQTPMATGHKFNGWADTFLNTPTAGLQDIYGGLSYDFKALNLLPGLKAAVIYHQFDSDIGSINYGSEWDASLGFKLGPVGIVAKYANYDAKDFGSDTEKFWLEAEFKF